MATPKKLSQAEIDMLAKARQIMTAPPALPINPLFPLPGEPTIFGIDPAKGDYDGSDRTPDPARCSDSATFSGVSAGAKLTATDVAKLASFAARRLTGINAVALGPEPEPIENAGIRVGEIIAERAWLIECDNDLANGDLTLILTSVLKTKHRWLPGQALESPSPKWCQMIGQPLGIHGFKKKNHAVEFAAMYSMTPFVVGRVALWGEYIEHEEGWRAQFARVESLDAILKWRASHQRFRGDTPHLLLSDLRRLYGV